MKSVRHLLLVSFGLVVGAGIAYPAIRYVYGPLATIGARDHVRPDAVVDSAVDAEYEKLQASVIGGGGTTSASSSFESIALFIAATVGLIAIIGAVGLAFHGSFSRESESTSPEDRLSSTEIIVFFSLLAIACSVPLLMVALTHLHATRRHAVRAAAFVLVTGASVLYMIWKRREFSSIVRGVEFVVAMNVGAEIALQAADLD